MALLTIETYPSSVLKKKASIVKNINSDLQTLIDNMAHTMHHSHGIGLAAPQIGIPRRIIIYNLDIENQNGFFNTLINPKILDAKKEIVSENEGCLSIPNFRSNVKRFHKIIVEGIDRNEKMLRIEAKGTLSIVLQHEIDHLNGTLFIDHISPLKRQIYKTRILKHLRRKR